MAEIDITDKIGYTLLKKGIIDFETLEKSLKMKDSDENKKNRKNLGQILVTEFGADHDAVFREVANLYAFREVFLRMMKKLMMHGSLLQRNMSISFQTSSAK